MTTTQDNRALIVFSIFLCLAYLLPFHTNPLTSFYNEFLAIWGLVIAFAFIGKESKLSFQIPWIALLPVGIAVVIFMQMMVGLVPLNSDSIFPVAYLFCAALAIILGATLSTNKDKASALCYLICYLYIIVGTASSVIASFQFFEKEFLFTPFVMLMGHFPGTAVRPVANIGQANHLALLFCLAIASTWWLHRTSNLKNLGAICVMLLLIWGLAITQSRIGWLIIPIFGLLVFIWGKQDDVNRAPSSVIVAFVLLYAVLVWALPSLMDFFSDLSVSSPTQRVGTKSGSERLALFQEAWKISLAHPWFGAGWNSFSAQQLQLETTSDFSVYASHSHNLILNFAAELGWPLTILVSGIFLYWFSQILLEKASSHSSKFALLFLLAVLIHSLVEFPLWYAYFFLPFSLLIGSLHQEKFESRFVEIPNFLSVLFFFIMSIGMLFIAMDYRGVMRGFEYLNFASKGFKLNGASDEKPRITVFPQFYDYFRFAKTEASERMANEDVRFMENMSTRFAELPNLRHMALIYALNNRSDDAIHILSKIKQLHRCEYEKTYVAWKSYAEHKPKIFFNIFSKLPEPDQKICGA